MFIFSLLGQNVDDDDDDDEMMMMMKEKSFVTLIGKRARSHFERLVPATNNHQ